MPQSGVGTNNRGVKRCVFAPRLGKTCEEGAIRAVFAPRCPSPITFASGWFFLLVLLFVNSFTQDGFTQLYQGFIGPLSVLTCRDVGDLSVGENQ